MADVMAERVRSIQRCVGICFIAGAVLITLSILLQPSLGDPNRADLVLEKISKQDWGGWMTLHAVMMLGFSLVAVGFTALGFLLHLRGASGAASVVTACALLGASLWVAFFAAELYGYRFLTNLYSADPSLATMLFSTVWHWKLGAMAAASVLTFVAVIAAGVTGTARGLMPVWLGWGGTLFAIAGTAVYFFGFLGSTATGAPINPMQSLAVRIGIGLPLQVWLAATGFVLARARIRIEPAAPAAHAPRPKPAAPAPPAEPPGPGGPPPTA